MATEDESTAESQPDWLDFLLNPQRLNEHVETLAKNNNKEEATELAIRFLEQVAPGAKDARSHRITAIVQDIANKCSFDLEQIEKLPISHQKRILLGLIKGVDDHTNNTNLHRWTLRAVSKRVPIIFLQKPEAEEEVPTNRLVDESFAYLQNILQSSGNKEANNQINLDIGTFFFFAENFQQSLQYLEEVVDKNDTVSGMISAAKSVLAIPDLEPKKEQYKLINDIKSALDKYQYLINAPSLDTLKINSAQEEILSFFIEDLVINAMSLCYRNSLVSLIVPDRIAKSDKIEKFTKQIIASNIVKEVLETESIERFVQTNLYLVQDILVTLYSILYAHNLSLKRDQKQLHKFIDLVCVRVRAVFTNSNDHNQSLSQFPFAQCKQLEQLEHIFTNKVRSQDDDIAMDLYDDSKTAARTKLDLQHHLLGASFEKTSKMHHLHDKIVTDYTKSIMYKTLHDKNQRIHAPNLDSLPVSMDSFILQLMVREDAKKIEKLQIVNEDIYQKLSSIIQQDFRNTKPSTLVKLITALIDINDWGFLSALFSITDVITIESSVTQFVSSVLDLYPHVFTKLNKAQELAQSFVIDMAKIDTNELPAGSVQRALFVNDRIRWPLVKVITETRNTNFIRHMITHLSVVLLVIRKSTNRDVGHLKKVAGTTGEDSGCINPPEWNEYEVFMDEVVTAILSKLLQIIVDERVDQDVIALLADIQFESGKYAKSLQYYLESYQKRTIPETVISRCIACLENMQEYTAAFVMHQMISDTGYDKRMVNNMSHLNGIQTKWLPYLWDMSYIELMVYLTHQRGETSKEKLLTQHVQRTEMNVSNNVQVKKQFEEQLWFEFLDKLLELVY